MNEPILKWSTLTGSSIAVYERAGSFLVVTENVSRDEYCEVVIDDVAASVIGELLMRKRPLQ